MNGLQVENAVKMDDLGVPRFYETTTYTYIALDYIHTDIPTDIRYPHVRTYAHTARYITLLYTSLHYITLHYIALHHSSYITSHYILLDYTTFQSVPLSLISLHYIHIHTYIIILWSILWSLCLTQVLPVRTFGFLAQVFNSSLPA